jgi:hypothetical protein
VSSAILSFDGVRCRENYYKLIPKNLAGTRHVLGVRKCGSSLPTKRLQSVIFFFFVVLGFELRARFLLGRHSIT